MPTPTYLFDEAKLEENCEKLHQLMVETGCKVLLAQKAFSAYHFYPMIGKYLAGTTASGLYEAKLGYEEMRRKDGTPAEVHVFAPAYRAEDMAQLSPICDHIVFNSIHQLELYADDCRSGRYGRVNSIGLRINPEHSTQEHGIYDPCAPGSRFGVTIAKFEEEITPELLEKIDGLHFHTLCEQGSEPLAETLQIVEQKFGKYLHRMKWINLGGGHHITREDYNLPLLKQCIRHLQSEYGLEVYLEPGEAIALNAGYLVTTVLEKVQNGDTTVLILDASAACHMPDVLEMPYRPPLQGSGEPGEKPFTYRLSSYTCLAGDIIGDYSFDHEIQIGDRLVFEDMAIYSFVKNNTFNGIPLPSLSVLHPDGSCEVLKEFGYQDFKDRLG